MAASFFCRNFGVFQLRTTTTRLTWSRFYGHSEPEPLTLRQQNDGIRYRSVSCYDPLGINKVYSLTLWPTRKWVAFCFLIENIHFSNFNLYMQVFHRSGVRESQGKPTLWNYAFMQKCCKHTATFFSFFKENNFEQPQEEERSIFVHAGISQRKHPNRCRQRRSQSYCHIRCVFIKGDGGV